MTNQQIIDLWLTRLKFDLIAEYDRQGRRASGRFEDSIELISTPKSAEIKAAMYAEQLEFGRGKTVNDGDGEVQRAIRQWIDDKNIVPDDDISKDSLAFLIARKIHREGWEAKEPLISKIITTERIQELIDSVFILNVQQLQSDILELLRAA